MTTGSALSWFAPRCPRCRAGALFKPGPTVDLLKQCPNCALDYRRCDSADGPAVLLIFLLGAALVPLAFVVDKVFMLPLWGHAVLWTVVVLGLTIGALRPVKALMIALQYRHRRGDWDEE